VYVDVKVTWNGSEIRNSKSSAAIVVTLEEKKGSTDVLLAGEVTVTTVLSMLAIGVRDVLDGVAKQLRIPRGLLSLDFQKTLLVAEAMSRKNRSEYSVSIDRTELN